MIQAFNKKFDDLQKDLEKVKRNQAGSQRYTRSNSVREDTVFQLWEERSLESGM